MTTLITSLPALLRAADDVIAHFYYVISLTISPKRYHIIDHIIHQIVSYTPEYIQGCQLECNFGCVFFPVYFPAQLVHIVRDFPLTNLLDKPWSQVSPLALSPPPHVPSFL